MKTTDLAELIERVLTGDAWHAASVRQTLAGLGPREVATWSLPLLRDDATAVARANDRVASVAEWPPAPRLAAEWQPQEGCLR